MFFLFLEKGPCGERKLPNSNLIVQSHHRNSKESVKCIQSEQWKHQSDIIDVILVILLLTLDIVQVLFLVFLLLTLSK